MNGLKNNGLFMFKIKAKQFISLILIVLIFSQIVLAQSVRGEKNFFTSDVVNIYFLMLLFATIINRLLEYAKLLVILVNQRVGLLTRLSDALFDSVTHKMDLLGINYDAQKVREKLNKHVVFVIMQFGAFVMGIFLAWWLQLNVMAQVQFSMGKVWGFVLTGVLIGAGVEPIHAFFRIAQEKRKIKKLMSTLGDFSDDSD